MTKPNMVARELAAALADAMNVAVDPGSLQPVHGGSISSAWQVVTAAGPVFVKAGGRNQTSMFEAEAAGLDELKHAAAVRVPAVLAIRAAGDLTLLALEWLDFVPGNARSDALLGEQLARLHRTTSSRYGWHRDNTIGSTLQHNAWEANWIEFLRTRRLGFQFDLAIRDGATGRLIDRGRQLCDHLDQFFSAYDLRPALLHGDLWSGNRSCLRSGEPVIFDPAVYYGDREADLAMTQLFGGFDRSFYAAYGAAWPLDAGAQTRVELYNLYHVLNHLHLFGGGYRAQAEHMIDRLLAQVGH